MKRLFGATDGELEERLRTLEIEAERARILIEEKSADEIARLAQSSSRNGRTSKVARSLDCISCWWTKPRACTRMRRSAKASLA